MQPSLLSEIEPPFYITDEVNPQWQFLENCGGYKVVFRQGALLYIPNFLNDKEAHNLMHFLVKNDTYPMGHDWKSLNEHDLSQVKFENIAWKQDKIIFGKHERNLPRLTAWHGDLDKPYTYSGITSYPSDWNSGLLWCKDKIEAVLQNKHFNSVLLNWYRNGQDSISWHSDDEKELGRNPTIASLSLGATREFYLRYKTDNYIKFDVPLKNGDLLIMAGEMQQHWEHAIFKAQELNEPRINLTYRTIYS